MEITSILLVQALPIALLGYCPLRRQFAIGAKRFALLVSVLVLLDFVGEGIKFFVPVGGLARIMLSLAVQMLIACAAARMTRQPLAPQIFLVLLIKTYTDNVRMTAGSIAGFFFAGDERICFAGRLLLLLLTLPLIYLPLRKHLWPTLALRLDGSFWRNLCIIPIGNFLLLRVAISPDYLWNGVVWPPAALALSVFWPLSTFFSYFAVLRMCALSVQNHLAQRQVRDAGLAVSIQAQQTHLARVRTELLEQEQARLEEKLFQMQSLLCDGDSAEARRVLRGWLGRLDGLSTARFCEHAAADSMVRQYMQWAEVSHTQMEVHLTLPTELPVPETDFFVVFGNLLENALESCARQKQGDRFIRVNAAMAGQCGLMISVRNSCDPTPTLRDGVYLSSKRDNQPGLGIASVQAIAQRCNGVARFQSKDGVFEASVLLGGAPVAGEEEL